MKKSFLIILFMFLSLSFVIFTGCKDPEPPHEHTFADSWTKDATHHWHASTCGHEVTEGKAAHTFGNWTTTKEATEVAEGSREKSCTVCGYKVTEAIEKLAHTHKFAEEWTSDSSGHWHASTCGHEVTEGKAAHTFGNWTTTKEATEEVEGTREKSCTVCGYKVTEAIAKLAHTHKFAVDWTKDATHHWHASTCEHTTEVSSKAAHSFGNWTTTKEATEEAEGSKERTCTVCGYKVTEAIAKLEHKHTYSDSWTKDATYHWHASTCGHATEVSEKAAHSFGNWTTTKEATEEAEGSRERSCSVCEYKATEAIAKLEHKHTYSEDWTKDATHHWHASSCGHEVTEGKAAHTFGDWTTTKEATEEETGTREKSCTVCGYKVTEAIAKLEHKHTYSEDWTKDATHHWHASTCGHEVTEGKAAHTFGDWTTTKEATEEETGTREKSCTVCGYKVTEAIAKLEHKHTFSEDWTKDATHHWHVSTCGHTEEVSGKAVHTFGNYVSNNDATTEADGTKTRECGVCGYKDTVTDEGSKIIVPEGFVFVKGGTVVGAKNSNNDAGVFIEGRTVTLSDFYMGKYEVTQEDYASVMEGQKVTVEGVEYTLESNPSYCIKDSTEYTLFNGDVQEKRPVEGVTWYDSVWYCNALSEKEGLTKAYNIEVTQVKQASGKTGYYIYNANVTLNKNANGYRLPTEAEWEYAARGGDPTKDDWNYVFSGADTAEGVSYNSQKNAGLDRVGWYCYNSINGTTGDTKPSSGEQGYGTHQVGKKAPNRLGLYDMSGNVYEWCYDWYRIVSTGTDTDPTGASSGSIRVYRLGAWYNNAINASVCSRGCGNPYNRTSGVGFRVVRSAN